MCTSGLPARYDAVMVNSARVIRCPAGMRSSGKRSKTDTLLRKCSRTAEV